MILHFPVAAFVAVEFFSPRYEVRRLDALDLAERQDTFTSAVKVDGTNIPS